ncbi:hypothetical protein MN116_000099 [Schistosoma mekongi]|uniref:Integrase catalytic domain-containing protein n=1 Tax=Schistosoma mekongi TaxID=38744 RepID=A0AAE1Z7V4_SCHME|nr:hypothetical protein MN116_000099 [Schistosoma mekongi]
MPITRSKSSIINTLSEKEDNILDEPPVSRQVPFDSDLCHGSVFDERNFLGNLFSSDLANVSSDHVSVNREDVRRLLEYPMKRVQELEQELVRLKEGSNLVSRETKVGYVGRTSPISLPHDVASLQADQLPREDRSVSVSPHSSNIPVTFEPHLPKVELGYFDGQPSSYWKFLRQFEVYIESKVTDDGHRLLYLLHYCKGKAKVAIEECVMLPPSVGYKRAKEILRRLFGQPHVIARELLDSLVDGTHVDYSSADGLEYLAIRMENCSITLEQMNYTLDLNCLGTLERIVKLLPQSLQLKWAELVDKITGCNREPTFAELTEFISSRSRIANSRFGQLAARSKRPLSAKVNFAIKEESMGVNDARTRCSVCLEKHPVVQCPLFLALSVEDRWSQAKKKGLCFVCLGEAHQASRCVLKNSCQYEDCKRRHHPLLHSAASAKLVNNHHVENRCISSGAPHSNVCLGIVPIRIRSGQNEITGNAFLDNGSDVTLIRADCVKPLGLQYDRVQTMIQTLGGNKLATSVSGMFEVCSLDGRESLRIERAVVVEKLPVDKSKVWMNDSVKNWPHLSDLPLDHVNGEILLLIGCDVPEAHWVLDQRLGGRKHPYAVRTLLGWTVLGPMSPVKCCVSSVNFMCRSESTEAQLRRMYDLEFADVHSVDKMISSDDLEAMEIVKNNTYFSDGHFVVPLPWRKGADTGRGNYELVRRRLESLKYRLIRDVSLRERYVRGMEDIISKGYAELVPDVHRKLDYRPRWYLPHHPVINPKKPEKLRIVLDCAAKYDGVSLNDLLYQGVDTTANLVGILLRFRRELIAVSADIEEMFMQVKVPNLDRGALRFLWWPDSDLSREPIEYQMTSHPFGATSSPFCANFALVKTAQMFSDHYDSYVQNAVQDNFYVDDCLISLSSVEQAKSFVKQINELMSRGGFKLKKWVSNSELVAAVFPKLSGGSPTVDMPSGHGVTHRTLGLEWGTKLDVFRFFFDPIERPLTRRGIMSVVSSLFDPLGLISPTCLPAKQLLQKLCKARLGWDQPLCESDVVVWKEWIDFMRRLGSVTVNRSLKREGFDDEAKMELHVFSDASESGYGTVAYARIVSQKRAPYCVLLFSKSRVAPIKHVTIPRLELAAALLSVRISELLKGSLPGLFCQTYFWTDSMIVLYYIKNCERRYVTFVANRLSVIHQYSQVKQWLYVKSEWNPADWTSRGITKEKDLKEWFDGPAFLRDQEYGFTMDCMEISTKDIEFKKACAQVGMNLTKTVHFPLLSYFSDWTKLIRAASWLRRYIDYITVLYSRHKDRSVRLGPLSVMEQEATKLKILKLVQEVYPDILEILRRGSKLVTHNNLQKLSPVMIDGLMCVGGRLSYSDFTMSFKHPIILPSRHLVTESIIRHYHKEEGHCGTSQVLASIRETYWIVKGISEVRRVIGGCVVCRRLNARIGRQMMAPLPPCRVKQGWYSFAFTGIDYFGPLMVRRGRSVEKRYGCVFTCLQSRAVHLEVAHDLSTDSFIMVLIRFIGRRGKPMEIYSDNGSNFVGAVSELRQFIRQWDTYKISAQLASKQIQWHFSPPSSSHRGGVWERMIRTIRRLLLVISNEQVLQEETLTTYMVEVERILNNRPLVPVTSDVNDRLCLTPNNLLLLRDCEGIAVESSVQDKYSRRWRQVNYLADVFWRRWRKEYLPTLQCRQKWLMKHRNLKEGDVVIISTDGATRGYWPLGIILKCEIDKDNLVRTVTVRTKDGTIRRDVRKVCLLEGSD